MWSLMSKKGLSTKRAGNIYTQKTCNGQSCDPLSLKSTNSAEGALSAKSCHDQSCDKSILKILSAVTAGHLYNPNPYHDHLMLSFKS